MSKADDRGATPPYTISTPLGERTLYYIGKPIPHSHKPDFLSVRLTLKNNALVINFPADTHQTDTKTGEVLKNLPFRPQSTFEHGARINKITPHSQLVGIGAPKDRHEWGQVIFQGGLAVSYAWLLEDRHTIEEKHLVMEMKAEQRRTKASIRISEKRQKELVEYALVDEPMTDADIRQHIIEKRKRTNLPPLSEDELNLRVHTSNHGPCSMFKIVDPKLRAATNDGERITWARTHAAKGPQTKEEREFVESIKHFQERHKMNALSMELADPKALAKNTARECWAEQKAESDATKKEPSRKTSAKEIEQVATKAADKAAEKTLAGVAPALRLSRLNPEQRANGELVEKFRELRESCTTDKEAFRAIAKWEIDMARKTPDKVKWMFKSVALQHYSQAVRDEPVTPEQIAKRATALERRYRRAKSAKRPTTKK